MPSRGIRAHRFRPALGAVTAMAALATAATGCAPDESGTDAKPSASGERQPVKDFDELRDELGLPDKLPEKLPAALKDLDKWRDGAWKDWDRDDWLREARDFINPIIEDHWDPDRMGGARENDRDVDESEIDEGVTDPEPAPVEAEAVPLPYTENAPPVGKVFMETPKGSMVCSGTVVKDPENPGRSNLVATAGHCVHAGSTGGWYRNVVFVPHFNDAGLKPSELADAEKNAVAPHGIWWAKQARTTDFWIENGAHTGGKGAPQDFAVLKVQPEDKSGTTLQETVGGAVRVDFGTPGVDGIDTLTANGYPAAPPFKGERMFRCTDAPGRLTLDANQPTMYRIGCTMTGGSSGGGWLGADGRTLLSVTSIGPITHGWLAGPRLGEEAKAVFDTVSRTG
ncbi:trypsin-like serine peptidase [Streptomyces sp. TR02-1]|uniref:trypsin-like serine peptidase n=1 Tax=Streptomyces sp. TR02-1 TaxID=3385977 RepID=UPI0039A34D78